MVAQRGQQANFRLLLLLFAGFRLSLLAFWPADQLARWSDYDYYYQVARWVDQGWLPYLHYWVEYPPLFSYLAVFLYLLTSHYVAFVTGLALVQLVFEVGSLVLLYRLARRALGEVQAQPLLGIVVTRHPVFIPKIIESSFARPFFSRTSSK